MSDVEPGSDVTIGERLRAAREAKKLSLAEVAAQTRIPMRHLQHIEDGAWESLPAPTYSVGFARSYANAVGLNGNEIGAELRGMIGTQRAVYDAPTSYYEPADPARVPPKSLALVAGLIAVLLIGGYLIWRALSVGGEDVEPAPVAEVQAPNVAPIADQPQTEPGAVAATGPVVLTAIDEVWLRIADGTGGAKLFEGVLRAGERYEVPPGATAPQLRTGRPQALRVTVGSTEIPPLGQPEQTIDNVSLLAADLAARVGGAPAPGTGADAAVPAGPLSVPPGQ